jgi:cytochrome c-type biogenesis protein CcmH
MIGFWISAGAMLVMVALVLVQALRQGRATALATPQAEDLAVYRDQLAEVERDLVRGTLAEAEAQRLRTEVQRRMLDADRTHRSDRGSQGNANLWLWSGVVVAGMAAAAGLYGSLGVPGYPDLPLAERFALADQAYAMRPLQDDAEAAQPAYAPPADLDAEFAALVEKLRTAVANRPDDLLGHTLLAQNETALGNFVAARKAQQDVVRLKGDAVTAEDLSTLAALMVTAAGGVVSPEAEQALIRTLTLDPRDGWARFYSGLMFAQIGRPDRTFSLWEPLLAEGPADAPWLPPIRDRIEAVADAAGVRFTMPATAPGPDAAAVAAAADMTPEDREAMIKTMVEGLEARLLAEGGTVEEWGRLITSLAVLGNADRARSAYEKAQAAYADSPDDLATLQSAAEQARVAP